MGPMPKCVICSKDFIKKRNAVTCSKTCSEQHQVNTKKRLKESGWDAQYRRKHAKRYCEYTKRYRAKKKSGPREEDPMLKETA